MPAGDDMNVGCFSEPLCGAVNARKMVYLSNVVGSQQECRALAVAMGYRFYALQDYAWCFASNSISIYFNQQQRGTCNMLCSGNRTQMCGGSCANLIFQVNYAATGGGLHGLRYIAFSTHHKYGGQQPLIPSSVQSPSAAGAIGGA